MLAMEAIQWYDKEVGMSDSGCSFSSLVQSTTTCRRSRWSFVRRQSDGLMDPFCHADITPVTKDISTIWALSKKLDPIPSFFLGHLNSRLRMLVPDLPSSQLCRSCMEIMARNGNHCRIRTTRSTDSEGIRVFSR